MKWFKHHSDLRRDEQVADYLDKCKDSMTGYGFLMTLLEIVSESMEALSPSAYASYPDRTWYRMCGVQHRRWSTHIEYLVDSGLIEVSKVENKTRLEIPKLLKWRDEYSEKHRLHRDKIAQEKEKEREREVEKEKEKEAEGEGEGEVTARIASLDFSSGRSTAALDQNLGEKIDRILKDNIPMFHRLGSWDYRALARVINQRDGKANPEPTEIFIASVTKCVKHWERRHPTELAAIHQTS